MIAGGGAALAFGATQGRWPFAVFGAFFVGLGAFQWRMGLAAQVANAAGAAINRGEMDEARELVELARARHSLTYVLRLLDSHEAEIAWREGDLEAAKRLCESARARRDLVPYGAWRGAHLSHIDGLLSLACAASGDDAGAEAAMARVRASDQAYAPALARAELAFALAQARRGDLEGAHKQLARHHVLLSEALEPRGRALHRALRRMTALRGSAAYRVPVKMQAAPGVGAVSTGKAWLSRVFPEGAELVEIDDGAPVAPALATPEVTRRAPPVRPTKLRAPIKVVALWIVIVLLFVAIWSLMSEPREPGGPPPDPLPVGVLVVAVLALLVGLVAWQIVRARRGSRVIEEASRALVCGELERAEALALPLRADRNQVVAATASAVLAGVLERRADVAGALAECERAIGLLTGVVGMGASDVLLPQLVATRAYLFGALGREDESDAELARLSKEFPAFPYAAGFVLRTRLLRAVRRGDLTTARELARARGDVSIGASGEIIAELVLSTDAEDRDERVASIREDLAMMPALEQWVRAVLPGFLEYALPRRAAV